VPRGEEQHDGSGSADGQDHRTPADRRPPARPASSVSVASTDPAGVSVLALPIPGSAIHA
jgi:hypothetical protein